MRPCLGLKTAAVNDQDDVVEREYSEEDAISEVAAPGSSTVKQTAPTNEQDDTESVSEEHADADMKKDVVTEFAVPETGVGTLTTCSQLAIKASDIRERYNRNLEQNKE